MPIDSDVPGRASPDATPAEDKGLGIAEVLRLDKVAPKDRYDYIDLDTMSNEGPVPQDRSRAPNTAYYARQKLR